MSQQTSFKHFGGSAPENYEQFFVPVIAAPLATDLIDIAALGLGERVLDVACGTGVVARLAAERVGATGTVDGIDLNPGMLAVARSVTPPSMAIEWHESSAEAIPLPDEAFDVVLCQMGLQFVPDNFLSLQRSPSEEPLHSFPIRIPAVISKTTEGIRREGTSPKPSGTTKAITVTISTPIREISGITPTSHLLSLRVGSFQHL